MTEDELKLARALLNEIQGRIATVTNGKEQFAFALTRYLYKHLSYVERGTPMDRRKLKLLKLQEQGGKCGYALCGFPDRAISLDDEPELDRKEAIKGHTRENTVLVHHDCHRRSQREKRFA